MGAYELALVGRSAFRAFPPRLPGQPIFYPVCNEDYAVQIASSWNVDDPNSGFAGFVTRFEIPEHVATRYPRHTVGAKRHEELWVPAAEQAEFCASISGTIRVTHGWLGQRFPEILPWMGPLGALAEGHLERVVTRISTGALARIGTTRSTEDSGPI